MPIFRVKSVKIYTSQKNLHWRRQWRQWQLSGMVPPFVFTLLAQSLSKRELLPQYICPEKVVFYGILSQLWKFLFFKNLDNNLNLNEKKSWTTHFPWEWQLHDCMLSELNLSSQLFPCLALKFQAAGFCSPAPTWSPPHQIFLQTSLGF